MVLNSTTAQLQNADQGQKTNNRGADEHSDTRPKDNGNWAHFPRSGAIASDNILVRYFLKLYRI